MPSKCSNYNYLMDNWVHDSHKIYYKASIAKLIDEASSSIGLPTYSTMQPRTFSSINVSSKPFEISADYLTQNFDSIENDVKREWFLSHFDVNAQSFIR